MDQLGKRDHFPPLAEKLSACDNLLSICSIVVPIAISRRTYTPVRVGPCGSGDAVAFDSRNPHNSRHRRSGVNDVGQARCVTSLEDVVRQLNPRVGPKRLLWRCRPQACFEAHNAGLCPANLRMVCEVVAQR